MSGIEWTTERRAVLKSALRKAQAAQQQREVAQITGQEGLALYRAAKAWEGVMEQMDELARKAGA